MSETQQPNADAADFLISHRFAGPRARVWEAWTRPELLARWFGPKGSVTELLEYDLRPDGAWRSRMNVPGHGDLFTRFVFREIVPPERLVYEHSFADAEGNIIKAPIFDHWPRVLLTTVIFEEDGSGTLVTLRWSPIEACTIDRDTFFAHFDSMRGGWGGSFDQLEKLLAQGG